MFSCTQNFVLECKFSCITTSFKLGNWFFMLKFSHLSCRNFSLLSGLILLYIWIWIVINDLANCQFSCSVMSYYLWLQHARLSRPSPTSGVYSNSCQWCHPTISSSVVSIFSCLQSFPASGSFQMSQFFASDGQSIGVSASASVLPMTIQDWFSLELTGWISLQSKNSKSLLQNHSSKASILQCSTFFYSPTHIHTWLLEKP